MVDEELEPPLPQAKYLLLLNNKTIAPFQEIISLFKYKIVIAFHALQLSSETRFSAMVLFHRFICRYFFACEQRSCTVVSDQIIYLNRASMACIFLACKLCDEPRRIRDLINLWRVIKFNNPCASTSNDEHLRNAPFQFNEAQGPPDLDARYWEQKDELVSLEQDILRVINFDTKICHPHRAVIALMNNFYSQGQDAEEINRRSQILMNSWKLLNDVSLYVPALRHPSLALASAVLYLSATKPLFDKDNNGNTNSGCNNSMMASIRAIVSAEQNKWWTEVGISDECFSSAINDVKRATLLSSLHQPGATFS